jgi:hypothetical protein
MVMLRTILAVLIATSVSLVPATGGATISVKPVEMTMADQADMPCCPPPVDCKGSIACAFKCFNFVAMAFPIPIELSHITDVPRPSFVEDTLHGHISSPTHPPPI